MATNISLHKADLSTFYGASSSVTCTFEWHPSVTGKRYYRLKFMKTPQGTNINTWYSNIGELSVETKWIYRHTVMLSPSGGYASWQSLWEAFPTIKVINMIVSIQMFSDSNYTNLIRESDSRLVELTMGESDETSPEWEEPTWTDISNNPLLQAITGSNQKALQSRSIVRFALPTASGKYNATIDNYFITIQGCPTIEINPSVLYNTGNSYDFNLAHYPLLKDQVSVTIRVKDSRGISKEYKSTLTVISYQKPTLRKNKTHRINQTGSTVILGFEGDWYGSENLTLSGEIYATQGESETQLYSYDFLPQTSGTSFSFTNTLWQVGGVDSTFDPTLSYTLHLRLTDGISFTLVELPLPVAIPMMSFRNNKIGVNNPTPTTELDVNGIISQNNTPVFGFVSIISGTEVDLDDYDETTGFYTYDGTATTVNHFPNGNQKGILELITVGELKMQRYVDFENGRMYYRVYDESWYEWHIT